MIDNINFKDLKGKNNITNVFFMYRNPTLYHVRIEIFVAFFAICRKIVTTQFDGICMAF